MIAVQPWKHVNYFQILVCLAELGTPLLLRGGGGGAESEIPYNNTQDQDQNLRLGKSINFILRGGFYDKDLPTSS